MIESGAGTAWFSSLRTMTCSSPSAAVDQALGAQQLDGLDPQRPAAVEPMSRCSGRMPMMVPARPPGAFFSRFIGGEPMKLATKVEAGR